MDLMFKAPIPGEIWNWAIDNAGGTSKFVNYIEYREGEVVLRIFAVQHKKRDVVRATEVMRRATGTEESVVKNLTHSYCGHYPVYEAKEKVGTYGMVIFEPGEFDLWQINNGIVKPLPSWYTNLAELFEIDEFKYCGYSGGYDLIEYLNQYRKDRSIEFFGKLGIPLSKTLMRRAKKDGKFRKFLAQNAPDISIYGSKATVYAYEHGLSLPEARRITYKHQSICNRIAFMVPEAKGTDIDRERLEEYLTFSGVESRPYNDYLQAVKALGLDLHDSKNVFPRDFRRMHDLRIAEYSSRAAALQKKSRDKLTVAFRRAASGLKCYEYSGDRYCVIIPDVPARLVSEGDALHHCVGKMGYDVKMAEGKSFIAFVRRTDAPDVPYVTAEVDCRTMSLLQLYGDHDSRPSEDVRRFSEEWEAFIKRVSKERKEKAG